jgi:D-glycero-D-manno-heptose 1,7-bisphosphate phosphatase
VAIRNTIRYFVLKPAALVGWLAGLVVIVTTNQPGLSRGTQSRRDLDRMHQMIHQAFPINDLLVCPHEDADRCPCRKPKPGLLTEAAYKWGIDLNRSFVVSDKWQDAEAARMAAAAQMRGGDSWAATDAIPSD